MLAAMDHHAHTRAGQGVRLGLGCLVLASVSGCSDIAWQPSLSAAQQQAARDGRVVLVYYWSLFNRDCKDMDRTVFRNQDVIETLAGTLPVRLDPTFHRSWARRSGVRRIPAFAVYGPDGQLLNLREGPLNEGQFRAFVISAKLSR